MPTLDDLIPHGPCCACGQDRETRNIVCLHLKAPSPGQGWGCFQCQLPLDGAVAVLCDDCIEARAEIKFVCAGPAADPGRVSIDDLPDEPFEHDFSRHPETWPDLVDVNHKS